MNAKCTLICKKCGCSMEFTSSKQSFVRSVICQNCGQTLPENDRMALEQAMSAIAGLPSETETEPGLIYSNRGFRLALNVTPYYLDERFESDEED